MFPYLLNGQFYFPGSVSIFAGLFGDGSAAAPSISFLNDPDTGFYRSGDNTVGFSSNGTLSLRFSGNYVLGGTLDNYLYFDPSGSVTIAASGGNKNITLTPSGIGTNFFTANGNGVFGAFVSGGALRHSSVGGSMYLDVGTLYLRDGNGSPTGARMLIATNVDSGALLQIGTNTTTSAGGVVFGTDTFIFRQGAGSVAINHKSGSTPTFALQENGSDRCYLATNAGTVSLEAVQAGKGILFRTNAGATALTLDSSQRAIFSGAVRLSMNYTAGVGAATGYLTVQDATGTTYKVPVLA